MKITHPYAIIINMTLAYIPLIFIDWRLIGLVILLPAVLYAATIKGYQQIMIGYLVLSLTAALFIHVPFIYLLLLACITAGYFIPADAYAPLIYFQLYYLVHLLYQLDNRNLLLYYCIHMAVIIFMMLFGRSTADLKYMFRRVLLPIIALILIFGAVKVYYPVVINALPAEVLSFIDFDFKPNFNQHQQEAIDKLTHKGEKIEEPRPSLQSSRSKIFLFWLGVTAIILTGGILSFLNRKKLLPDFQHDKVQVQTIQHTFRTHDFEFTTTMPKSYVKALKKLIRTGRKYNIYYDAHQTFNEYFSQYDDADLLTSLYNEQRYSSSPADRSDKVIQQTKRIIETLKQK